MHLVTPARVLLGPGHNPFTLLKAFENRWDFVLLCNTTASCFMLILLIYTYKNSHYLHGKLLFTWLSLVMSMMVSLCAVLDEIGALIKSVSESFLYLRSCAV